MEIGLSHLDESVNNPYLIATFSKCVSSIRVNATKINFTLK